MMEDTDVEDVNTLSGILQEDGCLLQNCLPSSGCG
jgi:hypothetical protein